MNFQANPGPSVTEADLVQTAPDGAGHQEGARRNDSGAVRSTSPLACSCEHFLYRHKKIFQLLIFFCQVILDGLCLI